MVDGTTIMGAERLGPETSRSSWIDVLIVTATGDLETAGAVEDALTPLAIRPHVADRDRVERGDLPMLPTIIAWQWQDGDIALAARISERVGDVPVIAVLADGVDQGTLAMITAAGVGEYVSWGELAARTGRRLLQRILTDHQERLAAERWRQWAQELKDRFTRLVDHHVDGILVIDLGGICRYANHAARLLLDRDEHGLIGDFVGCPIASATTEIDAVRRDGRHLILGMEVAETVWDGQPVWLASLRDVTDEVRIRESLGTSEQTLRAILDTMMDGLVIVDSRLRICTINRAAEEIFGFPGTDILGTDVTAILPAEVFEPTRQAKDGTADGAPGGAQSTDARSADAPSGDARLADLAPWRAVDARMRNGETVPVEVGLSSVDIPDWTGQQPPETRWVAVIRDMTEHRQTEKTILDAKNDAEVANRAKAEFLANMSHELRTPLNAIIGFAEIISDRSFGDDATARYSEYGGDILDSGRHLLTLINDILDMSRLDTGTYTLSGGTVRIASVVDACFIMVGARARAAGLKLHCRASHDLPPLRADGRAVKQILLNLLSNAVKYTRDGGKIHVTADLEPEGCLRLTVEDTGIGIDGTMLPVVTRPFSQARRRVDHRGEGTGLGLAISKSLIELHGGTLTIDSTPGVGTGVHIRFPAHRVVRTD